MPYEELRAFEAITCRFKMRYGYGPEAPPTNERPTGQNKDSERRSIRRALQYDRAFQRGSKPLPGAPARNRKREWSKNDLKISSTTGIDQLRSDRQKCLQQTGREATEDTTADEQLHLNKAPSEISPKRSGLVGSPLLYSRELTFRRQDRVNGLGCAGTCLAEKSQE